VILQVLIKKGGETQMATFDLNSTLGPIIDGVVNLMPSFLALVVAIVPVIITIAVKNNLVTKKIRCLLNQIRGAVPGSDHLTPEILIRQNSLKFPVVI
jgi:hypothetical protein